jgi:hypothetical protein
VHYKSIEQVKAGEPASPDRQPRGQSLHGEIPAARGWATIFHDWLCYLGVGQKILSSGIGLNGLIAYSDHFS